MKNTAKKIYHEIDRAQHILLVAHPNSDGDTSGSVTALYSWLASLDKTVDIFCTTKLSSKLEFLPNSQKIKTNTNIWSNQDINLVIVCDSGDLTYAGISEHIKNLKPNTPIINFDHHNTNNYFGDLNMVIDTEASTTAVLYRFFYYNKIKINRDMATSLLTGLVTDTGHFSNSATTKTSLHTASKLVELGANINLIRKHIVKDKRIDGLKLWGEVLSRINHDKNLDLVYTYISQKDIKKHKATQSDVEGVANFLNNLNEGSFALILKELEDKKVKGSFRTTQDNLDVSAMAKHFGGGGHKKAAGFTIDVSIENAVEYITRELTLFLKK